MKKYTVLFTLFFVTAFAVAQTDGLSYQAVILDPDPQEIPGQDITNNVLRNTEIVVRFTITNSLGDLVYRETQQARTDAFGMINLIIGRGTPSNGIFTEIDWNGKLRYLQVDINLDGNFKFLNKEALTFIPYAYHRNIEATGTLDVDGEVQFSNDLTVYGLTNLNDALSVNNQSPSRFTGRLTVEGVTTLNNRLEVTNESPTKLTGTLDVDGATRLGNTLTVEEATNLNSTLQVDGVTRLNDSLLVENESPTLLTGTLTVNGVTDLNSAVNINNGSPLNVSGNLNVDGATTLNDDLTVNGETNLNNSLSVNNSSPSALSGTLMVDGATTLDNSLQVFGQTNLESSLDVNNQAPANLSGSLTVDLETNLNSSLAVNNGAPTFLSGTLNVLGAITLNNNLRVNGITNLNNSLFVNNGSATNLSGVLNVTGATDMDSSLIVDGESTLNSDLTVANGASTNLTGTLDVDLPTTLNNSLEVTDGKPTTLSGTLNVDELTSLNNGMEVTNGTATTLTGELNVDGITTLNNDLEVLNGSTTTLSGTLDVDGISTLNAGLNVTNQSTTNLSGELNVSGITTLDNEVNINGQTIINNDLTVTGTANLGSIATETIAIASDKADYVATFTNTNTSNGDGILIKLGKRHGAYVGLGSSVSNNNGYAFIDQPLIPDSLTDPNPPINPIYLAGLNFVKGKLQNPSPITVNEIINNVAPSSMRSGAITAINQFVFSQLNSSLGIAGGKTLPPVIFPSTNILQGANIFGGVTIPFVNITIPSIDLPNIDILPNPTASIPGLLNAAIPDFIPALPSLPANGGIADVSIPGITNQDVPNSLTKANTYISFEDNEGRVTGSIRAQSISGFYAATVCDPVFLLNLVSQFVGVDLLDGVTAGAVELTNLIDSYNKIGVEFTSGNGDYAEWLERMHVDEYLTAGDIVAVKGGKITRDLTDVEQIMVVSHRPIILGNTPEAGKEYLGNNVAFMGQVPVKVLGPVRTGDYIVAHAEVPGYGKAVSIKEMTADAFVLAVGRSWEENLKEGPKMVNTVVGVHNGDWANIVKRLEEKQRAYERKFKTVEARVEALNAKAEALLIDSQD